MVVTGNVFDRIAEFYDYEHADLRKDIPFYMEYARQANGRVLELACGTGRVLIPLAQAGITITGLDISQRMLGVCQSKVDQCSPEVRRNVTLVQGDMEQFQLMQKYNLIFIPFNSFQCLLTREAQGACLQNVRSHLDERGFFILSIFAPKHEYLSRPRRSFYMGSFFDKDHNLKIFRRAETSYNYIEQTLHNDFFYEWTDQEGTFHRKIWSFDMSYLFRYEAELLLEKYGFQVDDVYGGYDKIPYDYYSGHQIFITRVRP